MIRAPTARDGGADSPLYPRRIGILGGMGPYAHVEFERRLLGAVGSAVGDADYPPWLLFSVPGTPDRTEALLRGGPSPVPALRRGLEVLAGGADFAVFACITAHAFLPELRGSAALPVLDLVAETLLSIQARHGSEAKVGLLATSGTIESKLFQDAARRVAPGLGLLVPSKEVQQKKVMESIYGRPDTSSGPDGRRGGIKSGANADPETGVPYSRAFLDAAEELAAQGAAAVILGCTEIGIALAGTGQDGSESASVPLVDVLDVGARAALATARGERPLPAFD